jgi:hypothetical protein
LVHRTMAAGLAAAHEKIDGSHTHGSFRFCDCVSLTYHDQIQSRLKRHPFERLTGYRQTGGPCPANTSLNNLFLTSYDMREARPDQQTILTIKAPPLH